MVQNAGVKAHLVRHCWAPRPPSASPPARAGHHCPSLLVSFSPSVAARSQARVTLHELTDGGGSARSLSGSLPHTAVRPGVRSAPVRVHVLTLVLRSGPLCSVLPLLGPEVWVDLQVCAWWVRVSAGSASRGCSVPLHPSRYPDFCFDKRLRFQPVSLSPHYT